MVIARVAAGVHWHALEDDVVVGRGHALRRPDDRTFISVDTWLDDVFETLATAMLDDLASPVHTVVDDDDREVLARWRSLGFVPSRREIELIVPTAPDRTGSTGDTLPPGAVIIPGTDADEDQVRELDRALRQEVDAQIGWRHMPAEVGRPLSEGGAFDPARYAFAVLDGDYVGLTRIAPLPRRPRLGLIAVRTAHRRRGLARGMLAATLAPLHAAGLAGVSVEVDALNQGAMALFVGLGAEYLGSALELVR